MTKNTEEIISNNRAVVNYGFVPPETSDDKKNSSETTTSDSAISLENSNEALPPQNERETWSNRLDFFFAALGYAVGLGAVWRFPYLCYKNGGGVFLIPYFVFLFLVGIPLVFLELCVGQFTSSGPLTCWLMCPIFRGVGLSMNIVNFLLLIYYNMILAYSLYFLVLSFQSVLPWAFCNSLWSGSNCIDANTKDFYYNPCNSSLFLKCDNGVCYNATRSDGLIGTCDFTRNLQKAGLWNPKFPSEDYWNNVVLQKSKGIEDIGFISWQLVLALFVAWLIVFAMVVRGIKVSGKLAYFTAIFPYVLLLILGIRAWMLEGADIGIKFYFFPDFSRLKDIQVWTDAANQIFFTLSVSYGGLVALSSYNKFNNNILRDAILVSISNCLTSVFAGFVIFAYIGYIAKQTGQSVNKVVQAGQGLAYVVYPYAVTTIKWGPLWAILFFLMMLILGMDTMMASVEIVITSLVDFIPAIGKTRLRKTLSIATICLILFASGLIYCTQAGTYWVELFDSYSGGWAVLLVGALECISITWFYGFNNFRRDIAAMLGKEVAYSKKFVIWRILWTVISPVFLLILVVLSIRDNIESTPAQNAPYWEKIVGNLITFSTISGFLIWAIFAFFKALCTGKPLKSLIQPDKNWKPKRLEDQVLLASLKNEETIKIQKDEKEKGTVNESFEPKFTKF